MTDAKAGNTAFSYDANGNLLSLTDPRGGVTSYAYDSRNRRTSRTDPLSASESYAFDGMSNLTSHSDRRGKTTNFTYDALNRRTFAGFGADGGNYESTISYAWDGGDRLTQVTESVTGTITRAYDGLNRLTSETTPQGSLSYTYDAAGRRTSMTVGGQPAVNYSWDSANRLTGVTQGSTSVAISYDAASRRTSLTLPNGIVATYTYDSASRLTGISYALSGNPVGDLSYSYDAAGRIVGRTGSLSTVALPQAVSGNTFNAANQMTSFGSEALTYDANGNLTADGTNTYTWNARNLLASIGGGSTAGFQYDGLGRRIQKSIGGQVTRYLHDGLNPVQEQDALGAPTANLLTGLSIDEFFQRTDSAGARSLVTDILGSTLALADSAGAIQTSYSYEPFGKATAGGASSTNSFQFTGRENDGTGLYYYRMRYYNPALQRFISADPIGFAGGINPYTYVANNPLILVDPLGLRPLTDCEKERLRPYIPEPDLNNANVDDQAPWWLPSDKAAVTLENDIHYRPEYYRSEFTTPEELARLGHELYHVGQYRSKGMDRARYLRDPERWERPARAKEKEILDALRDNPPEPCPCAQ
jgi:RHS repeat-associated protein